MAVKPAYTGQTKPGKMTGTLYEFPRQIAELDREYAEWVASRTGITPDMDTPVIAPKVQRPGASLPVDPERSKRHAEALAFIRDYTGRFGLILDLRADRRFGTVHMALSDRQIEVVLASKAREAAWAAERAPKADVVVSAEPLTHGMYRKDGSIYKVQIAVHGSGRLYAKVLVVDGPGEGHFEYAPGAMKTLTVADRMTPDEAAEFGRLYGICVVCGATLTDEKSIERGIGPVCRGKV